MPELWATGQSPFLSSLTYTCLFLIHTAGGFDCKRCCPKAPQASVLLELRTSGSLAMGASAMIQGSPGALEMLGRIVLRLNQKRFLN